MSNNFCAKYPFACNNNGSNKLIYDDCFYRQKVHTMTSPFVYQMYEGKYENCGKCRKDKFYHPFDLVDVESELRNQTRPATRCGAWKYNPNYKSPACQTIKSEPIKFEDPTKRYLYNDNPLDKQISHYYLLQQPNMKLRYLRPKRDIEITQIKPVEVPPPLSDIKTKDIIEIVGTKAVKEEKPARATTTTDNKDGTITVTDVIAEPTANNTITVTETETVAEPTVSGDKIEGFNPFKIHRRKRIFLKDHFTNARYNMKHNVEHFKPLYENEYYPYSGYPKKEGSCMNSDTVRCSLRGFSTFDSSVPVVYPPELCPIVFNNIKKPTSPGYFIPNYL